MNPLRVVVWGENIHERVDPQVAAIYPGGMHNAIADSRRVIVIRQESHSFGSTIAKTCLAVALVRT